MTNEEIKKECEEKGKPEKKPEIFITPHCVVWRSHNKRITLFFSNADEKHFVVQIERAIKNKIASVKTFKKRKRVVAIPFSNLTFSNLAMAFVVCGEAMDKFPKDEKGRQEYILKAFKYLHNSYSISISKAQV